MVAVDIPTGVDRPDRSTVTYDELRLASDALASKLQLMISGESVIAILLPRQTANLFVAQLAVLKAGAAYLCLEPRFPDEQIREMLTDSDAVILLSDSDGLQRATHAGFATIERVNVTEPVLAATPLKPLWLTSDSLAYVIYTSGTTGRPKGVMITHGGIANLVCSDIEEFQQSPGDRVAQGSSAAYDSSVEETWLALASGATLVVMDDHTVRLGPDLVPWLRQERITTLCPPPTLLRSTGCNDPEIELPDLRLLYVGGEPLPTDVADAWGRACRLVNGYGPTECSVTCIRGDIVPGNEISIGTAVPGMNAWILDEALMEVPEGEPGELCLGGVGLARGYHRSPKLTDAKFVQHPRLGRIYRTGDLAQRRPDENFVCLGRLDSQVKLRGYRIELEAIDVTLSHIPGIREAACRVQSTGTRQDLVAFLVLNTSADAPTETDIRTALSTTLADYMVPARFGYVSELPRTVGGKLNREALPHLEVRQFASGHTLVAPRNALEAKVSSEFQRALGVEQDISVEADFFTDLGGSSLLAAKLVSLMRSDPELASVAVRDIYEARTIEELARRVGPSLEATEPYPKQKLLGSPIAATAVQIVFLLAELILGSAVAAAVVLWLTPTGFADIRGYEIVEAIAAFVLLGLLAVPLLATIVAVGAKKLLIGRYRACREPVFGKFYVHNWIVQQLVRIIPWRLIEGTELTSVVLRSLGAKVGKRVHFHRGSIPLTGGWDLLEIGDDVTISQDAGLHLIELEAGELVVGPISLGNKATLGVRARVAPHASLGAQSLLTPLSSLSSGSATGQQELWDGIPARLAGAAPEPPTIPLGHQEMSLMGFALALTAARSALFALLVLPSAVAGWALAGWLHVDSSTAELLTARGISGALGVTAGLVVVTVPLTLALEAVAARLMGRVSEGVISVRSWSYIRVTLKTSLVESAGRGLSGTLFWPIWLRWAGMRIGRNCEVSTIIDVVPELVEIASDCFLADGIYLGPPHIQAGAVRLERTCLSANTFLGNHVVIPCGQSLPEDILIGVCTVADQQQIKPGTSWFGLPPFELARREVVEFDRSLTHNPTRIRYWNRVFWEFLRVVIPVGPTCAAAMWALTIDALASRMSPLSCAFLAAPLTSVVVALVMCGSAILLKWGLLGKVKPGHHALWSCWCSRWDFHYVLWSEWARPIFVSLEGTLMLNVCLRMLGMKIGRRVVLGGGFAQVVDPDMIRIGDGATVSATFQAHTFEDRVLKIGEVTIKPHATLAEATVVLYGAEIGEHTRVAANSVVMKHELLLPGLEYEGAPSREKRAELSR